MEKRTTVWFLLITGKLAPFGDRIVTTTSIRFFRQKSAGQFSNAYFCRCCRG
jgi:hypothetical protein